MSLSQRDIQRYKDICTKDYAFYRENEQWIAPKEIGESQGLIRLKRLKRGQQKILDVANAMQAEEGRILLDVFKARKIGASTFWLSWADWMLFTKEAYQAAIASMSAEATAILFGIAKNLALNHNKRRMPEARIPWPEIVKCNDNEVMLANASLMRVGTAGETGRKKELFRGMTPYLLLASEVAFWASASSTYMGMINSISTRKGSGSIVIRESTSNGIAGIGKWWYDCYQSHRAKDTDRRMVFISWMDDEENEAEPTREQSDLFVQWHDSHVNGHDSLAAKYAEKLNESMRFAEYEQELVLKHGASLRQLVWYYNILREKTDGSLEDRLFARAQENPSTPEESFQFGGDATFPSESLARLLDSRPKSWFVQCEFAPYADPVVTPGNIMLPGGVAVPSMVGGDRHYEVQQLPASILTTAPRFLDDEDKVWTIAAPEDPEGPFEVFEQPAPDTRYFAGIDVAVGSDASYADATACVVMRHDLLEDKWYEAAVYESTGTVPDDAADDCIPFLRLYGAPMVNIERPGPGDQLIQRLVRHHGYNSMYRRRTVTGKISGTEVGWRQNEESRRFMVNLLRTLIVKDKLVLRSKKTIEQFLSMRRKYGKTGKSRDEHPKDGHDDRVFAVGLAVVCLAQFNSNRVRAADMRELQTAQKSFKERDLERFSQTSKYHPQFLSLLRNGGY